MNSDIALFEDEAWSNFAPISCTRHLSQQVFGTKTILEHVAGEHPSPSGPRVTSLIGRDYLGALERRKTALEYNDLRGSRAMLVNARVDPLRSSRALGQLKDGQALLSEGRVVAIASVAQKDLERARSSDGVLSQTRLVALAKSSRERIEAGAGLLFTYPWEILESNGDAISQSARTSSRRPKLQISKRANVEEFVSLDTRDGPIIVQEGASIESFSRISGPCFIGKDVSVYSALIRGGTTIAEGCKVGGEVAHSIVYRRTNKAHFGYLGYSIVGEWVNIGAGAVTSDLKNTYGSVRVVVNGERVDTGQVKLGAMVGDMAKISIGTMIYGGKTLGVAARASGIVDRDVPDFTLHDGGSDQTALELPEVVKTQERMKARRDETLWPEERQLMERIHRMRNKN